MKYFKVWLGYEKAITITEDELPKAIYSQIEGKTVFFKDTSVNGKYISLIEPDYHLAMGFNEGYKLQAEDYQYIKRDCIDYLGYIEKVKQQVVDLIQSGQTATIGNPEEMQKLLNN